MLVVNCHIASAYAAAHGSNSFLSILRLGGHGVDLFFILSGWLLGHVLFKELQRTGTIKLWRFFQRRWLRTLPAYYAVLGFTFIQAILQGRFEAPYATYVVFLQTYLLKPSPFFGVSWSLCVEEHFYLLIAPVALWIGRANFRGIVIFAVLLGLPQIFRVIGFYGSLQESHVRLDQCAAGVALAFVHLRFPAIWRVVEKLHRQLLLAFLCLIVWAVLSRTGALISPPLVVYTAMSCFAVSFADRSAWWKEQIHIPGAYYIATRSYSIYLLHVEALAIAKRFEFNSLALLAFTTWGFTLVLSELLYRCVELPFMNLRERNPKPEPSLVNH